MWWKWNWSDVWKSNLLSKHVSNSPGIDYNAAAQSPCTVFNLLRTFPSPRCINVSYLVTLSEMVWMYIGKEGERKISPSCGWNAQHLIIFLLSHSCAIHTGNMELLSTENDCLYFFTVKDKNRMTVCCWTTVDATSRTLLCVVSTPVCVEIWSCGLGAYYKRS